jgi:hypothetical protein
MSNLRPDNMKGVYLGATRGRAIPRNSRRGCLCTKSNTYSRKCCEDGALFNQGIGQTQSPRAERGGFSSGFSNGFDI